MEDIIAGLISCLVVVVVWIAFGALFAWGLEWAWNQLVPQLLHGPSIDYGESAALYLIISLISGIFNMPRSLSELSKK